MLLPPTDRGLLYGDGVYATVRVEQGCPLFLDAHLQRLQEQCTQLRILPPPFPCFHTMIAAHPPEPILCLRILITGGDVGPLGLAPRQGRLLVSMTPYRTPPSPPLRVALFSKPLELVHAHLKTLANFNRCWVLDEAQQRGYDDGVSLSSQRYLLETSFGNLFWIDKDILYLPDPTLPYYLGVTLTQLLPHFTHRFVFHTPEDLPSTASLFRSSSLGGILPITHLETRPFPTHPALLASLRALLTPLTHVERSLG